jgi:peptidoglycan hydrolase CwlO-like protein
MTKKKILRGFIGALLAISFAGLLYVMDDSYTPPWARAVPCAEAAQITGFSPTSQPACNCIQADLAESLKEMAGVVKSLADDLKNTKSDADYLLGEWMEVQAENDQLKAEIKHIRHPVVKQSRPAPANVRVWAPESGCSGGLSRDGLPCT